MNHEYDRTLVVAQIRTQASQLADHAEFLQAHAQALDDVTGRIVGQPAHAWHTDHAADTLDRTAIALEDVAAALRMISGHVLYPPEATV